MKNIKSSKGKAKSNIQGKTQLPADLPTETLQARREWQDILKVLKDKNLQPRLLYLAKISFNLWKIKCFTDKQKLREFGITKPALQQILTGLT